MEEIINTNQLKMGYKALKVKICISCNLFFAFKKGASLKSFGVNSC